MSGGIESKAGVRCLIVEDNLEAAEIMTMFFDRNGICAETAHNGLDGLQKYLNGPMEYDVIFADLQMPVMDGYEMAKRMRESGMPSSRTVPIVAMSGSITGESGDKSLFNCFLRKPFNILCLTDVIEKVMQANTME